MKTIIACLVVMFSAVVQQLQDPMYQVSDANVHMTITFGEYEVNTHLTDVEMYYYGDQSPRIPFTLIIEQGEGHLSITQNGQEVYSFHMTEKIDHE